MVASLQGVLPGSLVHRFITSGKPGYCELCPAFVEKLEAHHICYSPEITIKICHSCHHKVHFWPNRLTEFERWKLLKKKFSEKTSQKLSKDKMIGIQALAKLIAPSRSVFVQKSQKLEIQRIQRSESERKQLLKIKTSEESLEKKPKLHHNKVNKEQDPKNK